jgi:hypothetical protein
MRIISPFHDYYDIGLAYGIDPYLLYLRETRLEPSPDKVRRYWAVPSGLNIGVLYFCGREIPFYTPYRLSFMPTSLDTTEVVLLTTVREVEEFTTKEAKTSTSQKLYHTDYYSKTNVVKFLEGQRNPSDRIHFKHNSPVILYLDTRTEYIDKKTVSSKSGFYYINPCLKFLNFQKYIDPYTAFQEISMFLGGVLGNTERDTVKITDDKILRDSKGFDDNSFKGVSPGKKKNRKKYKNVSS